MIDPPGDDDRIAYIRALINHRCPELGPADLALIADAPPDSDDRLPMAIGLQILQVVEALADKLDGLEREVRPA
jgi:hypothetical protein